MTTRTITVEALSAALWEWSEDGEPDPMSWDSAPDDIRGAYKHDARGIFAALPAEPAGAGLREAHNMLRRIIGAYRNPQADDPHALGDEIAGAEAFLRRATLAATPVGDVLPGALAPDGHLWTDTKGNPIVWKLDVERLAQALKRVGHFTLDGKIGRCRPYADLIAAAYEGEK